MAEDAGMHIESCFISSAGNSIKWHVSAKFILLITFKKKKK
jgi:hypothetical protein